MKRKDTHAKRKFGYAGETQNRPAKRRNGSILPPKGGSDTQKRKRETLAQGFCRNRAFSERRGKGKGRGREGEGRGGDCSIGAFSERRGKGRERESRATANGQEQMANMRSAGTKIGRNWLKVVESGAILSFWSTASTVWGAGSKKWFKVVHTGLKWVEHHWPFAVRLVSNTYRSILGS